MTTEQEARGRIDRLLGLAGWFVCDPGAANIHSSRGVAIREFPLKTGDGFADQSLYVDGKAACVIEARRDGPTSFQRIGCGALPVVTALPGATLAAIASA